MDVLLAPRTQISIVIFSVIFAILLFGLKYIPFGHITEVPDLEYDFIVVGSGSAGSVLGRRLSESGAYKVLVLEAGEQESWLSTIPFLAPSLQQTYCNWNYMSKPQKHSQRGLKDRESSWPRGMCLGGSGSINYMIHSWGTPSDFDSWNMPEWTYDKVYPYFKKLETYHSATSAKPIGRGKSGLIHVQEFDTKISPIAQSFLKAVDELNDHVKATPSLAAIHNSKRSSSVVEYLRPVLGQKNLHVVTNALVTKVLIDDGAAYGVEVVKLNSKSKHVIKARAEVLLSAGAIGSPHILLLSGIGPKDHLEEFDITVQRDHPKVGKHLQDHLLMPIYFDLEKPVSCNAAKIKRFKTFLDYFVKGKGYLSWNGVEVLLQASLQRSNTTTTDFNAILFNMGSVNKMFSDIANYDYEVFQNLFPDVTNDSKEGFVLMPYCTRPHSEGIIKLKSPFSSEPPIIDPRYLKESADVKCLISAIKLVLKLAGTQAFRELGATIFKPNLSCPSHTGSSLSDAAFLECWIRTAAITTYHPVGTCRMGSQPDDVVDHAFHVRGVDGLRIIDASVIPRIPSGPPNALVMAMAERGAAFILDQYKNYQSRLL